MSKIIGITVGTTTNPNKFGGVTDYNELPNKPITYLPDGAHLDDLTEEGVYVSSYYGWGEVDEYGTPENSWNNGPAFCAVSKGEFGLMWQTVFNGAQVMQRQIHPTMGWTTPIINQLRIAIDAVCPLECSSGVYNIAGYFGGTMSHMYMNTTISTDCSFILPTIEGVDHGEAYGGVIYPECSICIYAYIPAAVSIDWGADVLFYDGQVPVIEPGYYDIIFTFDPNAEKWCVGVLYKGAAE